MTGIALTSKPRLARGVRLRRDRISGKLFLLRPEMGFELVGSAGDVVTLCRDSLTVAEIARRLAETFADTTSAVIVEDVARLLADLAARGLIDVEAAP